MEQTVLIYDGWCLQWTPSMGPPFLRQSKSSSVKTQINFKEEKNLNQYIELADWKQSATFAAFFQIPTSPGRNGYLFIHLFFKWNDQSIIKAAPLGSWKKNTDLKMRRIHFIRRSSEHTNYLCVMDENIW